MPPHDDFDYVALDRYFAGELSADEVVRVRAWIEADSARTAEVERLRAIWAAARPGQPDTEAALKHVMGRTPERAKPSRVRELAPRRSLRIAADERAAARRSTQWIASIAKIAAVLVVVSGGALVLSRTGWFAAVQPVREIVSAAGSRTTLTLKDGTRLVLGPATRLRVPGDFGVRTRTVELDGEGLFTVVHDVAHPFVVRTARGSVRDVGTTFAVRDYGDDPEEQIAVAEGEVAVGNATLTARDVATVGASGAVTVRRGVDVARYTGWAEGKLVFDGTPLSEAVRDVARAFGLEVRIADSTLGRKLVTASFANESEDEVLNVITNIVGARYDRSGRTVVIRRGSVPAGRREGDRRAEERFAATTSTGRGK